MNEIGKTKTPNAGEWWVRNDDGAIVFICGCDQDGDPVWIDDEEELHNSMLRFFTEEYHHEPRCTGFDWVEPVESSKTIMDCPDCGEFRGHGHVCRPASLDPDDMPLNPVPGTVVATGTVKLTLVQLDDWVEFDATQITCPRVSVDWLTPRLGENHWGPALAIWSNATWAAQREIWKIRCRRRDLPIKPAEVSDMAAIVAEHTQQVRELTQRIGDLVQQVNERDAVIEGIRTALHVDYSV